METVYIDRLDVAVAQGAGKSGGAISALNTLCMRCDIPMPLFTHTDVSGWRCSVRGIPGGTITAEGTGHKGSVAEQVFLALVARFCMD